MEGLLNQLLRLQKLSHLVHRPAEFDPVSLPQGLFRLVEALPGIRQSPRDRGGRRLPTWSRLRRGPAEHGGHGLLQGPLQILGSG